MTALLVAFPIRIARGRAARERAHLSALAFSIRDCPPRAECEKPQANKARRLLFRHLSRAQKKQLNTQGCFKVKTPSGRVYTLRRTPLINITRYEDGVRFCGTFRDLPLYDVLLGQKLLLEADEEGFLAASKAFAPYTLGALRYTAERV